MDLIEVKDLSYTPINYPENILSNISLKLKSGRRYAVIGPSGCGKTTFLLTIAKLLQPTAGKISYFVNNCRTSLILQESSLFPWKSVQENILIGLSKEEKIAKANKLNRGFYEEFGITKLLSKYPYQLSGGEKQRVAIARSLVTEPQILLMDESLSALDYKSRNELQKLLIQLQQTYNFTLLIITHNLEEAINIGHDILIFSNKPTNIAHVFEVSNDNSDINKQRQIDELKKILLFS